MASPVTQLVKPGPAVTPASPVLAVQRAQASAMCRAAASCLVPITRTPVRAQPSVTAPRWPPGRQKKLATPADLSTSATATPPWWAGTLA